MPGPAPLPTASAFSSERRAHRRQSLTALVYVDLDEFTGGIINNLSEGGLELRSAVPIFERQFTQIRFQLSDHAKWLTTTAKIVWMRDSNRHAGLAFLDPSPQFAGQIAAYLGMISALAAIETPGLRPALLESSALATSVPAPEFLPAPTDPRPEALAPGSGSDITSQNELDAALAVAASAVSATLQPATAASQPVRVVQAPIIPLPASMPQPAPSKPIKVSRARDRAITVLLGLFLLLVGWTARGLRDQLHQETRAAAQTEPTQDLMSLHLPNDSAITPSNSTSQPSQPAEPAVPPPAATSLASPSSGASVSSSAADVPPQSSPVAAAADETIANSSSSSSSGQTNPAPIPVSPSASTQPPISPARIPDPVNRAFQSDTLPQRDPISLIQNGHLIFRAASSASTQAALLANSVTLRALIAPDGRVRSAQPISGQRSLAPAALEALRTWRFEVLRPSGQPVPSTCDVTISILH